MILIIVGELANVEKWWKMTIYSDIIHLLPPPNSGNRKGG